VESNITEAVKKIPNEVAQVFLNPEKATVKIKGQIEWVLKYFGVNDPLMGPGLIINYIEFANLSRLTKKYDEAIAAAKRAIEINPNE
jgi:hypothetical protein